MQVLKITESRTRKSPAVNVFRVYFQWEINMTLCGGESIFKPKSIVSCFDTRSS